MFLTNPSQLGTVLLLLTGAMVEARDLPMECCTEKMVGSVSYTLLPGTFQGELPSQCLNGCVYTVSGTSSPKFCFAKGDLPTECLSEVPGTGSGSESEGTTTTAEEQVIFMAGGLDRTDGGNLMSTEVYPQISGCSPASLPTATSGHALFITGGTNPLVASCGGATTTGFLDSCLVWDSNNLRWVEDMMSPLLQPRGWHAFVTIENIGVYAVGGYGGDGESSQGTSEFLPANSFQWTEGPNLPSNISEYYTSCALPVSATSFIVISSRAIREYEIDIENPTTNGGWLDANRWPALSYRVWQGCARTEKSVIIAGGHDNDGVILSSTMVLDIATRQVEIVGNLITPRASFLLATVTTDGITRHFALGGWDGSSILSSVEEWDEDGKNWKPAAADLQETKTSIAAIAVPLRLVCPVADP